MQERREKRKAIKDTFKSIMVDGGKQKEKDENQKDEGMVYPRLDLPIIKLFSL